MEPEIDSASPSQISLWPLALLGTALALLSLRKPPAQTDKTNNQAIHPEDRTDPKSNTAPQQVGFVPNTIPPPQQSNSPEGGKKRTPEWEKAAVFIALGILFVNAWQSWETRKSAGAAKSAAETAKDSLVLANRPWVKIKHRIVEPLNFEFRGAAGPAAVMTVEDTLENVGNSVALDVDSWEDLIPVDSDLSTRTARNRRDEWCNGVKKFDPESRTSLNGQILFPKDQIVQNYGIGPLMSTVEKAVQANTLNMGVLHHGTGPNPIAGKVAFVMVGCVAYRSSFEKEGTRPHVTGFLYRLGEPTSWGGMQPYVIPRGTADKLRLIQIPDGSLAY